MIEIDATNAINAYKMVVDMCNNTQDLAVANQVVKKLDREHSAWTETGVYVRNVDALQIAYGGLIGGDCFLSSLECYWKLRANGAVRLKGVRNNMGFVDTPENPHYWVENKGMVFDCGGGQQKIYKSEKFYELMGITWSVEGNEWGFHLDDHWEVELQEKLKLILVDAGIKTLCDFIHHCSVEECWKQVQKAKANGITEEAWRGGTFEI